MNDLNINNDLQADQCDVPLNNLSHSSRHTAVLDPKKPYTIAAIFEYDVDAGISVQRPSDIGKIKIPVCKGVHSDESSLSDETVIINIPIQSKNTVIHCLAANGSEILPQKLWYFNNFQSDIEQIISNRSTGPRYNIDQSIRLKRRSRSSFPFGIRHSQGSSIADQQELNTNSIKFNIENEETEKAVEIKIAQLDSQIPSKHNDAQPLRIDGRLNVDEWLRRKQIEYHQEQKEVMAQSHRIFPISYDSATTKIDYNIQDNSDCLKTDGRLNVNEWLNRKQYECLELQNCHEF